MGLFNRKNFTLSLNDDDVSLGFLNAMKSPMEHSFLQGGSKRKTRYFYRAICTMVDPKGLEPLAH